MKRWTAALFAIFCLSPALAHAQEGGFVPPDEEFVRMLMELTDTGAVPEAFRDDAEALIREKLAWERQKILDARHVVEMTNRTANFGSVLVHGFVLVGMILALFEFIHAWRLRTAGSRTEQHEVRLGLEGLAVKTSLYGLIILGVASGFYLLFLKFVYPVQILSS